MKLLASDFDHTLYFPPRGFKKKDLAAIKRWQKEGHLFGVSTGRSLFGVQWPSRHAKPHYDFYICNSGATIYDGQGELLFERTIAFETVKKVIAHVPAAVTIVTKKHTYFYHYSLKAFLKRFFRSICFYRLLFSIETLKQEDILALSFHFLPHQKQQAQAYTDLINEHYGDQVAAYLNIIHIDLAPAHCSKGTGISFLKEYYQLDEDDLYGIGDALNDLSMLQRVKHSFTFQGSSDPVKKQARHIVDHLSSCIEFILKTP